MANAHRTHSTLGILAATCGFWLFTLCSWAQPPTSHPWEPTATETVAERFPPPPGTTRLEVSSTSFGAWLRQLPLAPPGTPVHYHDGRVKPRSSVHVAVIDLDVGARDLQQCADAVIRLRSEHLWARGCSDQIAFNFTSGDRARWRDWQQGLRPKVRGNKVDWVAAASADASYGNFRRYLNSVFTYAGSYSLHRELETVHDPEKLQPGDVFIQGGFPGHAVVVLDVAVGADKERHFLLAQSYMPAQDVHVLDNPASPGNPWYPARSGGVLRTPEWTFEHADLRRFPMVACGG